MNLCISHGKIHVSHPSDSLAHGKKLFFPAVMPKKKKKKVNFKRTNA